MIWPFEPFAPMSFDVFVADPPWEYELYSELGDEKSASAHYETMPLDQIKALPVGYLARGDALMLLCGCGWMPPADRQSVLEAWGFTYKSELMWRKTTRRGKVRMGPGYRVRTMHEPIYLGVIGNPIHKPFPSIIDGVAREHSRKPEELFSLVVKHTPHAFRLELFGRETRPGFEKWGREADKFDDPNFVDTKRERRAPAPLPEPMALFEKEEAL